MSRIALALLFCASCDMVAASSKPPVDQRVTALEKRVSELEIARIAAADRHVDFENCVADADDAYWNYIKLNGWLKRGTKDTWRAPMTIWNQAATDKRNAIEICKATWKKAD